MFDITQLLKHIHILAFNQLPITFENMVSQWPHKLSGVSRHAFLFWDVISTHQSISAINFICFIRHAATHFSELTLTVTVTLWCRDRGQTQS